MNARGNMDYVSQENINEFSEFNNDDLEEMDKIDRSLINRKKLFSPGNKWANFLDVLDKLHYRLDLIYLLMQELFMN